MNTLEKIIDLKEKRFASDRAFEKAMGLKPKTVDSWKRGNSKGYLKYLPEISKIFNVSADYLLGNEQKEKPFSEEESLSDLDKNFLNKIRKLNPQYLKVADSQIDALLALQEKQGK